LLSLFMKPKSYRDYVEKATFYDFFFMRKKAMEVMQQAVEQPFNRKELGSGFVYLGLLALKGKQTYHAVTYFLKALEISREETFTYSPNFKTIIETLLQHSDAATASYWLNHLLERRTDDRRFRALEKYRKQLK